MTPYRIDPTDLAIIEALQRDGRASNALIGEQTGLSGDAVRVRVSRMRAAGVIRIVGMVDPSSLGLEALATIGIEYYGDMREFIRFLRAQAEVTFDVTTLGRYNVIIAAACRNAEELLEFAYGHVATMAGVRRLEIWSHLKIVKWETRFERGSFRPSTSPAQGALSEMDRRLLRYLVDDPRVNLKQVATEFDAPYQTVRRHAQGLFDRGIVRAATIVNRVLLEPVVMAALALAINGRVDAALAAVAKLDAVELLVRTGGRFQAVAEIASRSIEELVSVVDEHISSIEGVQRVEIYRYAEIGVLPNIWSFPGQT